MGSITGELLLILLLILANGFFSGAELAILSARRSTIARLVAAGNPRARLVAKLQNDPHRFLATVQIGITVVGSLASAIGGTAAVEYLVPLFRESSLPLLRNAPEITAIGLVVGLVSYLSLVLGELVPKTIGLQQADRMALLVAGPIQAIAVIAGIAVWFLTQSNRAVLALFGCKPTGRQAFVTRDEVLYVVAAGGEAGAINPFEQEVISNMLALGRTQVRMVMVPRPRMVGLDLERPREELIQAVLRQPFTYYPAYRRDPENVTGIIHTQELLAQTVTAPESSVDHLLRPAVFVPETRRIDALLRDMQQRRLHMALVVDEYGALVGLVTTDDLLEELVGEVRDERDGNGVPRVEVLGGGGYLVDALLPLKEFAGVLNLHLDEKLPCDTLAGLVLYLLGHMPLAGEKVEWQGYVLTCVEVTPTSIVRIRIDPVASSRARASAIAQ